MTNIRPKNWSGIPDELVRQATLGGDKDARREAVKRALRGNRHAKTTILVHNNMRKKGK